MPHRGLEPTLGLRIDHLESAPIEGVAHPQDQLAGVVAGAWGDQVDHDFADRAQ